VKRIIIIIVLGICLAAGWGYYAQRVSNLETDVRWLNNTIESQGAWIAVQEGRIAEQEGRIAEQEGRIAEQVVMIRSLRDSNEQKDAEIEELTFELGEDMLLLPRSSPEFDCDDSALYMYEYFTSLGYETRIVVGNLDMTNESYNQSNHVWVWVSTPAGVEISYDWGRVSTDEQHGWGYVITYKELLLAAAKD